jgi:flavin-dependent dehydrogenase
LTLSATLSVERAADRIWDALVVGAGPAGALAARQLALAGLSVLLVDRASFPRHKVCGCCLNLRALHVLDQVGLGTLPAQHKAVPLDHFHLASGPRAVTLPLPGGVALSREALDGALVQEAIHAGSHFLPNTVARVRAGSVSDGQVRAGIISDGQVRAGIISDGREGPSLTLPARILSPCHLVTLSPCHLLRSLVIGARTVLAADGLGNPSLAQQRQPDTLEKARVVPGSRVGVGAASACPPGFYQRGTIFMSCGAQGYLGLVVLEDGRLDLAAALDPGWLHQRGGIAPAMATLLEQAGWPVPEDLDRLPWRGTPLLTRRMQRPAQGRLFVLGDATGYVEPFTGEGIAWALASARALAPLATRVARDANPSPEALTRANRDWERAHRQLITRRQLACRAIAALLRRPRLTRALVRVLGLCPLLARPVLCYLNHQNP